MSVEIRPDSTTLLDFIGNTVAQTPEGARIFRGQFDTRPDSVDSGMLARAAHGVPLSETQANNMAAYRENAETLTGAMDKPAEPVRTLQRLVAVETIDRSEWMTRGLHNVTGAHTTADEDVRFIETERLQQQLAGSAIKELGNPTPDDPDTPNADFIAIHERDAKTGEAYLAKVALYRRVAPPEEGVDGSGIEVDVYPPTGMSPEEGIPGYVRSYVEGNEAAHELMAVSPNAFPAGIDGDVTPEN